MENAHITTPFGRRTMTLAQVKGQMSAAATHVAAALDKWKVLRDVCEARTCLGLRDRALAVLHALISFHPGTTFSADDNLVVFPSNAELSTRAHGISGTTLRENLAILVACGIIHRRDSPNGKRYARRAEGGRIETAYGFSLAPLLARATEFAALAAAQKAERERMRCLRESVTLLRRDVRKLISAAIDEQACGDWLDMEARFVACVSGIARLRTVAELESALQQLSALKREIVNCLMSQWKNEKNDANASGIRHHIQDQNTDSHYELEPAKEMMPDEIPEGAGLAVDGKRQGGRRTAQRATPHAVPPLGMILRACPEIVMYGPDGRIERWRDLMGAATVVRSMLGVSPSAYQHACLVLGQEGAAGVMACILERANHIHSAGGYLRALTSKAERGEFSLTAMVMALIGGNTPGREAGSGRKQCLADAGQM